MTSMAALQPLFLDALFRLADVSAAAGISKLPWALKPVVGLVSDVMPIGASTLLGRSSSTGTDGS